jgi:hypothetical protein
MLFHSRPVRSRASRVLAAVALAVTVVGLPAVASASQRQDADAPTPDAFVPSLAELRFDAAPDATPAGADPSSQTPVTAAIEYTDGYRTRNRIHHIASFATLPLFAAEAYLGQRMVDNPAAATPSMRHWHGTIAIAITGLFGLNSVTGLWNLREARKDPHGRGRRTLHAVLMLIGDAGFAATALDHPSGRRFATDPTHKTQHLVLAYSSISVSTVGYLVMLFR